MNERSTRLTGLPPRRAGKCDPSLHTPTLKQTSGNMSVASNAFVGNAVLFGTFVVGSSGTFVGWVTDHAPTRYGCGSYSRTSTKAGSRWSPITKPSHTTSGDTFVSPISSAHEGSAHHPCSRHCSTEYRHRFPRVCPLQPLPRRTADVHAKSSPDRRSDVNTHGRTFTGWHFVCTEASTAFH